MQPAVWTDGSSNEPLAAVGASGNLFDVLGVPPMIGRTLTPAADRSVLGRRIELNGTAFTVVGVMPNGFEYPRASAAWVALVPAIDSLVDNTQIAFLNMIARVRPGVSISGARNDASRLMAESAKAAEVPSANVGTAQLTSLDTELLGDARRGMLVLLGAAGLVLLVACANVANLLLARTATRDGDLAVRIALGASRGQLVRQLLTEAGVLGIIGAAVGLGTCVAAGGPIAAFTALLMVGTTLMFGALPALRGTRVSPGAVLRAAGSRTAGSGSARRTQRTLVAAEVALAVVLLVGGGVWFAASLGSTPPRLASIATDRVTFVAGRGDRRGGARRGDSGQSCLARRPGVGAAHGVSASECAGAVVRLLSGRRVGTMRYGSDPRRPSAARPGRTGLGPLGPRVLQETTIVA